MNRIGLPGLLSRLGIYFVVCVLGAFGLIAVFAQLRFDDEKLYNALFTSISGLESGNFVRIAGVEVGKVKSIKVQDDVTVRVEFSADETVALTEGSRAVIRYDNLIGGRYLALEEGAGSTRTLAPGGTIPLVRTAPALDLDALIGGFRPLLGALDPDQVNALTAQLIDAFQGQGPTIGSVLTQVAALTSTLADRDELIGQVVVNLNSVLGTLGDDTEKFSTAVDSMSELVDSLESRQDVLSQGLADANAAAGSIADLLVQARPPLQKTLHETDRVAGTVVADHDYLDKLLSELPESYRLLKRQAMFGDFFSFYICDIVLKLNGKGGQPVFVKVVGQNSGRCAPK